MGRFKGRSSVACTTCHSHKLKCSGEIPCQRCRTRKLECTYPERDRMTAVSENYLRSLERKAALNRSVAAGSASDTATSAASHQSEATTPTNSSAERDQLLQDISAERFVERLKELSLSEGLEAPSQGLASSPESRHTYSRLDFDIRHPEVSIKLPPRPYAFHLLSVFEEGYCEYHFFLRKTFRERLALTYSNPSSQAGDRGWLCKVSLVLALGETWSRGREWDTWAEEQIPSFVGVGSPESSTSAPEISNLPAGSALFEQGLQLFSSPSEEPKLEDVEALNLITFCSYSLNRRKTAYLYAGQSIRLATLLRHDTTRRFGLSSLLKEHANRLWWMSYCLDLMVSTELGMPPVYESVATQQTLPATTSLSAADAEEFFDTDLLVAQIRLCRIRYKVVDTVTHRLRLKDGKSALSVMKPCLETLKGWQQQLPERLRFLFENEFPVVLWHLPFGRALLSAYLRYHQCVILLLRPLFLQEVSNLAQKKDPQIEQAPSVADPEIEAMKRECFNAAQYNCKILVNLWEARRVAKFGYWESLHLFSSLALLSLSKLLPLVTDTSDGLALYPQGRALLAEMKRVGNPASSDHMALLADVEELVDKVLARRGVAPGAQTASQVVGSPFSPGVFFDAFVEEQSWGDMSWEGVLEGWSGEWNVQDLEGHGQMGPS